MFGPDLQVRFSSILSQKITLKVVHGASRKARIEVTGYTNNLKITERTFSDYSSPLSPNRVPTSCPLAQGKYV